MQFKIPVISENPATVFRRAGYAFQYEKDGEMSFVRPLAKAGYPRFHLYARVVGSGVSISFHLDQKSHTYGQETRHHGEYENEGALKIESDRLQTFFKPSQTQNTDFSL